MTEEKNKSEKTGKKKIIIWTAAALAAVLLALGAVLLFVKPEFALNGDENAVCEIFEKYGYKGVIKSLQTAKKMPEYMLI